MIYRIQLKDYLQSKTRENTFLHEEHVTKNSKKYSDSMSMLATQRVRLLNRSCDQLRFQTGRDPTTTPLNSYHETAEMKKFRTHHSTLSSQATVVEIDMKNIEPTYFLVLYFAYFHEIIFLYSSMNFFDLFPRIVMS